MIEEGMEVQEVEIQQNTSSQRHDKESYEKEKNFVAHSACETYFFNRRCSLRPRKLSQMEKTVVLEEFIHSPKKNRKAMSHRELETIFEEPVTNKDGGVLLGLKQTNRFISFSQFVSKTRKNKRKIKVKKLKLNKSPDKKKKKKSFSVQDVEGKMTRLGI